MVFTKLQYNIVFYDIAVLGKFARKNRKMTHQFSLSTENKCQLSHPLRQIYMEIFNKLNKSKIGFLKPILLILVLNWDGKHSKIRSVNLKTLPMIR